MTIEALTDDPLKRRVIGSDIYFDESWARLRAHTDDPVGFCHRHSVVLLKPDAVAARALLPAIEWLTAQGFRIVAATTTRLSRHMVRALWHDQWLGASAYRRWLADLFAGATESLVLVVRADTAAGRPASVALTAAKGPADPAARRPGQLRHLLGRYSFLLNLVHTPDEPVDVAREFAIYCDERELDALYDSALTGADRTATARERAHRLYGQVSRRDLTLAPATGRLLGAVDALTAGRSLPPAVRTDLRTARREATAGPAGCRRLLEALWRHQVVPELWDVVVTGSYLLPMRQEDAHPGPATRPAGVNGKGARWT